MQLVAMSRCYSIHTAIPIWTLKYFACTQTHECSKCVLTLKYIYGQVGLQSTNIPVRHTRACSLKLLLRRCHLRLRMLFPWQSLQWQNMEHIINSCRQACLGLKRRSQLSLPTHSPWWLSENPHMLSFSDEQNGSQDIHELVSNGIVSRHA